MSSRLIRTLYKSTMRLALKFDREPLSKSLIYRRKLIPKTSSSSSLASSSELNNSNNNKSEEITVSNETSLSPVSLLYSQIIDKVLEPHSYFYHCNFTKDLKQKLKKLSFAQLVKNEFRKVSNENSNFNTSNRKEVAFAIIKNFSNVWSDYEKVIELNEDDVSEAKDLAPPQNLSFEVKLTDEIKPGTILLSHPIIGGENKSSVILILSHSESEGTVGVILNKHSSFKLNSIVKGIPNLVYEKFGGQSVSFGGTNFSVTWLHNFEEENLGTEIKSFIEVKSDEMSSENDQKSEKTKKLFWGGDLEKIEKIIKNKSDANQKLMFFVGACQWEPQSLIDEINSGNWIPVNANTCELVDEIHATMFVKDKGLLVDINSFKNFVSDFVDEDEEHYGDDNNSSNSGMEIYKQVNDLNKVVNKRKNDDDDDDDDDVDEKLKELIENELIDDDDEDDEVKSLEMNYVDNNVDKDIDNLWQRMIFAIESESTNNICLKSSTAPVNFDYNNNNNSCEEEKVQRAEINRHFRELSNIPADFTDIVEPIDY